MRLLSTEQAAARAGDYHVKSILRLVRQGRFPQPVRLAPNKLAFDEDEIDAWIRQRLSEREIA